MAMKVILVVAVLLVAFLAYVSTRKGEFHYARSGVIQAPAEKIFPYLTDFRLGAKWNPYSQKDPNLKTTFKGPQNQVGSIMEFDGNREAGSGSLEIIKMVPNQLVQIRLIMTKPMVADNVIDYTLTPEGGATRFTWAMSGEGGFMSKLVSVFLDCEKMVAGDFEQGIANLKALVEAQK